MDARRCDRRPSSWSDPTLRQGAGVGPCFGEASAFSEEPLRALSFQLHASITCGMGRSYMAMTACNV